MKKPSRPLIAVSDERGVRTLHVGGEAIQSSMRLGDPWGLALDSHGTLYVADSGNHRVQKLIRRATNARLP